MLCGALAACILALAAQRADRLVAYASQPRVAGVTAMRPVPSLPRQFQPPDSNGHPFTFVPGHQASAPQTAEPPGSILYRFNGQTYYITPIGPVTLRE
jgi:hypothetical protein